jgi:hypothetical protein
MIKMYDMNVIKVLNKNTVFSDKEKKYYYEASQNMDEELRAIFMDLVQSKNQEELLHHKKRVQEYLTNQEEKKHSKFEKDIKDIYKNVETYTNDQEEKRMKELLSE